MSHSIALIIQQSALPKGMIVEECERRAGNDFVIRFQRPANVSGLQKIQRFFEDLFTGTQRVEGLLCNKFEQFPKHIFVQGRSFTTTQESNRHLSAKLKTDESNSKKENTSLVITFTPANAELPSISLSPANPQPPAISHIRSETPVSSDFQLMKEDLRGQFLANDWKADLPYLSAFLTCAAQPKKILDSKTIVQLMAFNGRFIELQQQKELHQEVVDSVKAVLTTLQSRIQKGEKGRTTGIPEFSFRDLALPIKPDISVANPPPASDKPIPPPIPSLEGHPALTGQAQPSTQLPPPPPPLKLPTETVPSSSPVLESIPPNTVKAAPQRPLPLTPDQHDVYKKPDIGGATPSTVPEASARQPQVVPTQTPAPGKSSPPPPPPPPPPQNLSDFTNNQPKQSADTPNASALEQQREKLKPVGEANLSKATQGTHGNTGSSTDLISVLEKAMAKRRTDIEDESDNNSGDKEEWDD